tara:strand:+ start:301 stop:891 length:591 start_codon:yes stop_codon:yes gene_type:complete
MDIISLEKQLCATYQKTLNYSLNHKNGNRSKKRTDILNDETSIWFSSLLHEQYKRHDGERRIPCSRGKTFDIDVSYASEKKDIFLLLKSAESSYNKNKHNYLNGMVGETTRILYSPRSKECLVVFVNYIPERIPVRNKLGEIKNYETPHLCDMDSTMSRISNNKAFVIDVRLSEDHQSVVNMSDVINKVNIIKSLV